MDSPIIISHRGNIDGPSEYENTICHVESALNRNFFVEIDVWKLTGEDFFRLGHDKPILHQSVPLRFLQNKKLFCHCKNDEAYEFLKNDKNIISFKHTNESEVKTNNGIAGIYRCRTELDNEIFWKHSCNFIPSGKKNDVYVMLGEDFTEVLFEFGGICTDYPLLFSEYVNARQKKHWEKIMADNIKRLSGEISFEVDKEILEGFKNDKS